MLLDCGGGLSVHVYMRLLAVNDVALYRTWGYYRASAIRVDSTHPSGEFTDTEGNRTRRQDSIFQS